MLEERRSVMNRPSFVKFCVALLVGLLAVTPPAFACSQCCNVCGPLCPQILYDNSFDEDCAWVYAGAAHRVVVNGNAMGELYGIGSISQEFSPGDDHDLRFDLLVVPGVDPGTERVAIEIVSGSGTLLATIDEVSAAGTYNYDIGDYSAYGTVYLRFRMKMLPDPGDTVYRIDNVYLWRY
jgi:hypothetical protein